MSALGTDRSSNRLRLSLPHYSATAPGRSRNRMMKGEQSPSNRYYYCLDEWVYDKEQSR